MRDWRETVREQLESCKLPPRNREEIITELAAHLEETCEEARTRRLDETEAVELALQEAGNWNVLAENISRVDRWEEKSMNYRTKSLWIPGLASLAAASLFLLALTQISMQPHFLVRLNSGLGGRSTAAGSWHRCCSEHWEHSCRAAPEGPAPRG